MSGGFQTAVNQVPAIGVAGDFASANPYWTYDAGPAGLVAGPNGVTVGLFAWALAPADFDGAPATVNNTGSGAVSGFVGRQGQPALITQFLGSASMVIPAGYGMELMTGGDFYAVNDGAAQALKGMKAYANFADGKVTFAATGSPTAGATSSSSSIAASTSSFTGSIAGDILAVTAVASGTIYPGTTISGTDVVSGTKIVSQLSGSAGGVGTYAVSIPEQNVASTTISGTYGTLTVGGTIAGTFGVGNAITGTGVVAGTTITAAIIGTGGTGTYVVDNNHVISPAQEIDAVAINVETKWYAESSGLPGELVKISDHAPG